MDGITKDKIRSTNWNPQFRIPSSEFRIRGALFARLDDQVIAITDDYDVVSDDDASSHDHEDGLDLWGILF